MPAATLKINIIADAQQASATMGKAADKAGAFGAGLRKAALPAAAVVAGLGMMGKAAADDERAQAILANTLKKTAGATDASIASTEDWITKTALATGVADDQLRPALGALSRATGDVGESQKAMGVALDVAAATGKDVGAVSAALAKGYSGNTGALKKLVPGLDAATLKSGDMNKIMSELAKMTGGTAAKAAETNAGKMQRAAVAMDEVKETAGAALMPVLGVLGTMLGKVAAFAQQNEGAMRAIVIVLGLLAGAILVANAAIKVISVATKVWAGIQWLMNTAMFASPITWIVIGILALIAVIVIAYKKSATFRTIVQAAFRAVSAAAVAVKNALITAWNAVKTAFAAVWNWLKANVFGPIGAALKAVGDAAKAGAGVVKDAWEGLKSALRAVYDWIEAHVIDPMSSAFDTIRDAVQWVIDKIKAIKIPAPVQKLLDMGKSLFMVPPAATTTPTPAPTVGGRGATRATGSTGSSSATRTGVAAISPDSQVIVQVSDRKLAALVDVSIRASATAAARNLTRRSVVTV